MWQTAAGCIRVTCVERSLQVEEVYVGRLGGGMRLEAKLCHNPFQIWIVKMRVEADFAMFGYDMHDITMCGQLPQEIQEYGSLTCS